MTADYYRREIQRHRDVIAKLQGDKASEAGKANTESRAAAVAVQSASKATNASSLQSKLNDARRHEDAALRHQKRIAEFEDQIAREHKQLLEAHRQLARAEDAEQRSRLEKERRSTREHEQRMRTVQARLEHHETLHRVALSALEKLQHLPERITVLFLAANPLDQQALRLDEEARAIGEMIRKSEYRDAVRLESRWAARPLDLLQAINECRPRVVHFSGHGSREYEIIFQDEAGHTKLVSREAVVATMAASSDEIQLVFFNACFSRGQAQAIVRNVPAAIGMNDAIGDDAARVFAAQFYSSIGFGHSVARAFAQAKAALLLEGIAEDQVPELFVAEGLDANELVLVRSGEANL